MPDVQRPDFDGEPSLDAIRRADSFIDALAVGRPAPIQDAADAELAALLGTWRDETRWPPATGLISEDDAIAALNAGRNQKRLSPGLDRWTVDPEITPRKTRRGLSMVGAAAAAVLCIGGFGAIVAGAGPGDGLYGLRTMLFGAPKEVRDDQVGLAAKTTLNQVQDLIEQGDWNQAQNKLVEVSNQVASIGDQQQKQDLLDQFNDLSAKVVERDPAATAPPGVVYTVPPSAAELVPAVAPPTSTPSAPPSSTSASATTSASTSASASSSTSAPASATTTSDPSEAPASAATTTPTSASTPASAAASTPGPATETPPAPTSVPTSAPAVAGASESSSSESESESAPEPEPAQTQQATTPTNAAPASAETPAAPAAPAESVTTPAAAEPPAATQSEATTTAAVPEPVG